MGVGFENRGMLFDLNSVGNQWCFVKWIGSMFFPVFPTGHFSGSNRSHRSAAVVSREWAEKRVVQLHGLVAFVKQDHGFSCIQHRF